MGRLWSSWCSFWEMNLKTIITLNQAIKNAAMRGRSDDNGFCLSSFLQTIDTIQTHNCCCYSLMVSLTFDDVVLACLLLRKSAIGISGCLHLAAVSKVCDERAGNVHEAIKLPFNGGGRPQLWIINTIRIRSGSTAFVTMNLTNGNWIANPFLELWWLWWGMMSLVRYDSSPNNH